MLMLQFFLTSKSNRGKMFLLNWNFFHRRNLSKVKFWIFYDISLTKSAANLFIIHLFFPVSRFFLLYLPTIPNCQFFLFFVCCVILLHFGILYKHIILLIHKMHGIIDDHIDGGSVIPLFIMERTCLSLSILSPVLHLE